ncbi:unnamed protein product [Blepharisma stoltei]|uniref:Uncharacterized protein n=1 Tax=Blepharisma stoltei TaxID=1481888 RepID=A0AAU9JZZ6_9CILI|nr:unnamed protein product [Blepharisma stoltei]
MNYFELEVYTIRGNKNHYDFIIAIFISKNLGIYSCRFRSFMKYRTYRYFRNYKRSSSRRHQKSDSL